MLPIPGLTPALDLKYQEYPKSLSLIRKPPDYVIAKGKQNKIRNGRLFAKGLLVLVSYS